MQPLIVAVQIVVISECVLWQSHNASTRSSKRKFLSMSRTGALNLLWISLSCVFEAVPTHLADTGRTKKCLLFIPGENRPISKNAGGFNGNHFRNEQNAADLIA